MMQNTVKTLFKNQLGVNFRIPAVLSALVGEKSVSERFPLSSSLAVDLHYETSWTRRRNTANPLPPTGSSAPPAEPPLPI